MSNSDPQLELQPLRRRIDELDGQIVEMLNERAKVVVDIGKIKRDHEAPIYTPEREQRVLDQIRRHNRGPLPDSCVEGIWRELMSGSFALERPLQIGYLGPPGSFSHLAARRKFGASVGYADVQSIAAVFGDVEAERSDLGLVPIENSSQGGIGETLDSFVEATVKVYAEVLVGVHHNLLARCSLEQIKRVYSKPEALSQCQRWLAARLPKAERIPVGSTSKAVEMTVDEQGAAAVGSTLAGEIYGVKVLSEKIEDNPRNVTRFFVISRRSAEATGDDKTAIMFTTTPKVGALSAVLDVLRKFGLNLTHIDKRPSRMVNWEYYFFVDFEGHQTQDNITKALDAVRECCLQLTVLGSFPRARQVL